MWLGKDKQILITYAWENQPVDPKRLCYIQFFYTFCALSKRLIPTRIQPFSYLCCCFRTSQAVKLVLEACRPSVHQRTQRTLKAVLESLPSLFLAYLKTFRPIVPPLLLGHRIMCGGSQHLCRGSQVPYVCSMKDCRRITSQRYMLQVDLST